MGSVARLVRGGMVGGENRQGPCPHGQGYTNQQTLPMFPDIWARPLRARLHAWVGQGWLADHGRFYEERASRSIPYPL